MDWLHELYVELSRIDGYLYAIVHPNLILAKMLDDSVGLLLNVWFKFILSTTDLETGGDFVNAAAIQRFEPKVQLVADAALVHIALWASYRIMWGHGLWRACDQLPGPLRCSHRTCDTRAPCRAALHAARDEPPLEDVDVPFRDQSLHAAGAAIRPVDRLCAGARRREPRPPSVRARL